MAQQDLESFGSGLWIAAGRRVRMMRIPFSTRMTVARLGDGSVWIHSPVDPTDDLCEAVDALGPVAHVVAPNKLHSLASPLWKRRYPAARLWVSPGLCERHPGFPADEVLSDARGTAWSAEIRHHVFRGSSFLDEVVFLHGESKTLIVTDLIQRHDPREESWFWRLVKQAAGVLGEQGGTARDLRFTFHDRAAARQSVSTVLGWDFEQVVLSHGLCITNDAKGVVERAFRSWLG
jgi:Domain of unknown function (DUF4336)